MKDELSKLAGRVNAALLGIAPTGKVVSHAEKPWASITFSGTRHGIKLLFEGADAVKDGEYLCDVLPDYSFNIRGQLVADTTVIGIDHRFGQAERLEVEVVLLLIDEGDV